MATTRSKRGRTGAAQTTQASATPPSKKSRSGTAVTKSVVGGKVRNGKGGERLTKHLFKSEPESRVQDGIEMKFSIDDLMAEKDGRAHWDGVRNYEARNCMQRMKVGDLGFFYHSNTKKSRPGIVGIVEVVKEAYPDHTAFDPKDPHYDAKSSKEEPRWFMVDLRLVRRFYGCATLDQIKKAAECQNMQLVKRGRISVQDVTDAEWAAVLEIAEAYES